MTIPTFTVTDGNIETISRLVELRKADEFVLWRTDRNVIGPTPEFTREEFWYVLLGCLMTTQQKSTKGMPVDRFLELKPFPLTLEKCSKDLEKHLISTLTAFGGIRMAPTIARRAKTNYDWLDNNGWTLVETHYLKLASQRNRAPLAEDRKAERHAAYFADNTFAGIGPKQSRNLWQWLGLTRYEIPLDGRICKWINENLSSRISIPELADYRYYDAVLDHVQMLCDRAQVLPCIFDAAAFDYEQKRSTPEVLMSHDSKGTTATGYVNPNGQVVVRDTGMSGTDKYQRIYQIACSKCGHTYGANGSDCHLRLCPECQGGAEGLPLGRSAHA